MPFIQFSFQSQCLGHEVDVTMVLPQLTVSYAGGWTTGVPLLPQGTKFQTLYLLHGLSDNHRMWTANTLIEHYATERNVAVVMPSGDLSFYADMAMGGGLTYSYGKFIGEELIDVTRFMFPLSCKREDTFIAGLSMGGYGALRVGLEYADTFSAIGALSGVLGVADHFGGHGDMPAAKLRIAMLAACFGSAEQMKNTVNDVFFMSNKRFNEGKLPFIYQACGTEDFLLRDNRNFNRHMLALGAGAAQYRYDEAPGVHNWEFWDRHIQDCLDSFPLARKPIQA